MEEGRKKNSHEDSRILMFFVLAPIIYTVMLMPFMPERVPMHMDMLGNITRWWNKGNMLPLVSFSLP